MREQYTVASMYLGASASLFSYRLLISHSRTLPKAVYEKKLDRIDLNFNGHLLIHRLFSCKMDSPLKSKKPNVTRNSLKYFDFVGNVNGKEIYKCKICKIGGEVNGTKKWNLSSHLKCHSDIYKNVTNEDKSIEYKRMEFLLQCVHIVTINGRVFRSLTDSGLLLMNKGILEELRVAGREVNLRDEHLHEVKEVLQSVAEKVRQKIAKEMKNRPISLMLDIVSKRGRSILGASIQYIVDDKVIIRSIGMIDLKESHTGIYLAELIMKRLKELGINLTQIISITTDNGKNVLKMVRDLENHLQKSVDNSKKHKSCWQ